ncbi:hypothetical protein B0J12DRAFT_337398 [Macrophomina phaseolina]|uniref:Secreted protein n=1 Tax=Macrophomina phaseolina TaxID=35725 RepID=A0ABQ8GLQ4_9PEZI|nr:hypothetical protein B0J12DRAFT_337398 [Macrophomina phaseolina]
MMAFFLFFFLFLYPLGKRSLPGVLAVDRATPCHFMHSSFLFLSVLFSWQTQPGRRDGGFSGGFFLQEKCWEKRRFALIPVFLMAFSGSSNGNVGDCFIAQATSQVCLGRVAGFSLTSSQEDITAFQHLAHRWSDFIGVPEISQPAGPKKEG